MCFCFRVQVSHLLWSDFPSASSNLDTITSWPYNPRKQASWFGLFRFRSPLLTESNSLSFPPVTEMFHFTGCCSTCAMYSHRSHTRLIAWDYSIRKSSDHSVLTAPRGLSQFSTSFIASWRQGIHHTLFVA